MTDQPGETNRPEDMQALGPPPAAPEGTGTLRALAVAAGVIGLVASVFVVIAIRPLQWNVVTDVVQNVAPATYLVPTVFAGGLLVLLFVGAIAASREGGRSFADGLGLVWPLIGAVPLATAATAGATVPFYFSFIMTLGVAWSAGRVGSRLAGATGDSRQLGDTLQAEARSSELPSAGGSEVRPKIAWVYAVIALLIAVLTIIHARLQINFFDHFMLGHADFGHFTEELKNALAGRGLRSDSFPNTRLGWHFVPLLYVLVPGYALWPSPVYLMAVGALVVHLPTLPIVAAATRRSRSAMVGLLFGLAWLLLPSTSRLIYSNTYGFQWIYVAMPLIAVMIAAGLAGRWRLSIAMAILVLLCKETAAAATLGWGLYMLLFTPRRKSGAALAVGSIAYALICIYLIIPHFAASGVYERTSLFGDLGANLPALIGSIFTRPGAVLARLIRPEAIYLLLLLLVPMALLPLRGWRVLVAAVPTLVLILLLDNPDWLSIKFWHHATVLPFVFFAAIASLPVNWGAQSTSGGVRRSCSRGIACALVFAAGWSHYFFGFSPLAKPYEVYAESAALHWPDPRLETVRRLRAAFPKTDTILATERLAAHFTDYKRLYTGSRILPADVVIIDRSDRWDTTDLPKRAAAYAADPNYDLYGEFGSIVVFVRH